MSKKYPVTRKTTTEGGPFDMPVDAGVSRGGVTSSMDPTSMQKAMAGPSKTTTTTPQPAWITHRPGFSDIPGPAVNRQQTKVEPGISGTDVSQQVLRDVMAQKQASIEGREQVMGQADAIQGAGADAATRLRQATGEMASVDAARAVEFSKSMDEMAKYREKVEAFGADASRLREDQIARAEELRLDSLESLKTPFGLKMNSIIGGMKNQFGNMVAQIDQALQTGQIDPQAAQQMKQQAKMAHLGSIGTYASQLASQQADTQAQYTAQINQATLAARQQAINAGLQGEQASMATVQALLTSEAASRASYDNSMRQYELGLGQLSTAITDRKFDSA